MKKRLFAMFLVLVMMTVAVTACGKSGNKESSKNKKGETTETKEEKPVYQFTIWGSKADLSDEKGSWLKTRCDMFAAKHQSAELEFKYATYTEEKAAKKMEENREKAADIFIFNSAQTAELVESRLLTRLWGETEDYVLSSNATSIGDLSKYAQKVYGIPVEANPYVLYYDKRTLSQEDVQNLDTILAKGVLAYPLDDENYRNAFYQAQDVVEVPEQDENGTEDAADDTKDNAKTDDTAQDNTQSEDSTQNNTQTNDAAQDNAQADTAQSENSAQDNSQTDAATPDNAQPDESTQDNTQDNAQSENGEQKESEPLAKETVDAWLATFRSNPKVLNDTDGDAGIAGLKDGTVQAAVQDASAYDKMKEALGENLGVAALPVFTIDGMTKQMKCVTEAKCIGVNPDCENFEMTIALATYLGSADSQQMHYDMSGVIPVNLSAVQTLRSDVELADVIAQIADKENPGWDLPEEEEEE